MSTYYLNSAMALSQGKAKSSRVHESVPDPSSSKESIQFPKVELPMGLESSTVNDRSINLSGGCGRSEFEPPCCRGEG